MFTVHQTAIKPPSHVINITWLIIYQINSNIKLKLINNHTVNILINREPVQPINTNPNPSIPLSLSLKQQMCLLWLLITYYFLLITYYFLLVSYYFLLISYYYLLITYYFFVSCWVRTKFIIRIECSLLLQLLTVSTRCQPCLSSSWSSVLHHPHTRHPHVCCITSQHSAAVGFDPTPV